MKEPIDSGYRLRKILGPHLTKLKALDPITRERRRTTALRLQLVKRFGEQCGLCCAERKPDAAHIIPLQMGATTEESNLILLCKRCHRKYDEGHMSISDMQKVAREWRKGRRFKPILVDEGTYRAPAPTIIPPPKSVAAVLDEVLVLQRDRKFVKATQLLDRKLAELSTADTGYSYLRIKRAEITRRRAASGVVPESLDLLRSIDISKVSKRYLPVYFYELCYVHRLLGDHAEAAELARKSSTASLALSTSQKPGVDYVAAEVNVLVCELSALESLTPDDVRAFERQFKRVQGIAAKRGAYWGGRWELNCAAQVLQARIKAGDPNGSWSALSKLRDMFFRMNIRTGWDIGIHQSLSLLEGLVCVMFPRKETHTERGIGLLARSFVSRVGYRQRPEGIRDVGFALANSIRALGIAKLIHTADVIEDCMHRTVDGTSVIHPWRATKK